jgi:hypothetical protein
VGLPNVIFAFHRPKIRNANTLKKFWLSLWKLWRLNLLLPVSEIRPTPCPDRSKIVYSECRTTWAIARFFCAFCLFLLHSPCNKLGPLQSGPSLQISVSDYLRIRIQPFRRMRIRIQLRIRIQIQAKSEQVFVQIEIFFVLSMKVTFYKRYSLKYAFKH